jgi:hypothetical protein
MPRRSIIALAQPPGAAKHGEPGKITFAGAARALPTPRRANASVAVPPPSLAAGARQRALAAGEG